MSTGCAMICLRSRRRRLNLNSIKNGWLNEYLASINEQAEDMFFRLVKEYADRPGVMDQLKAENQLLWVQKINNIWACVREVVIDNIVFK